MEGQTNDEELLRKEINHITRIFRQLRTEGTKLDQTYVKEIAVMAKSVDQWGKALTLAKASVENEKSMAQRWSDRSGADMKALKLRKLMNTEAQTSRKLLQQQKSDDVERHIKMRNVMGKSSDAFNFFTKSLTKGLGFGEAIGMATEKLRLMGQAAMEQMKLEEMQKAYDDEAAKGGSGYEQGEEGKKAAHDLDEQKKLVTGLGGNTKGEGMGKMSKSLGKMGQFAAKHKGGMLLGAGAGGLILGVIIKALSVAPMFQAMMKLMKFAVTMILMPIGTFFGAILRPIMIGLIKNIAPQFKDWMKTANDMGTKLGEYIMHFGEGDDAFALLYGGFIPLLKEILPNWANWKEWGTSAQEEYGDEVITAVDERFNFDVGMNNLRIQWEDFSAAVTDSITAIGVFFYETLPNGINFVADNVWLGLLAVETFFTETMPNGINTIADGIWTGLEQVGKLLLTPFLMFIGTINSIFMIQLPELFTGFWTFISESFQLLQDGLDAWLTPILEFFGIKKPEKDMEKVDKSTKEVVTIAESISNWWDDIMGNTEESKEDSKDASNAMEGISKIFDSAASWINNALKSISSHTYIDSEGNSHPTNNAITAMGISPINIDAGGSANAWYSRTAANGFSGMVNSPTMFMAGEAGAEHVNISPHGNKSSGVPVVNINIARIDKNADFEQLKPAIQRWILEANSRRGMI